MPIDSKNNLIEAIAEAITSNNLEYKWFLDLTAQEVTLLPEEIFYDDFDNEKDIDDEAEDTMFVKDNSYHGLPDGTIKEIRTHQLIEIDSIPSRVDFHLMEDFAEQHDNDRLFRALRGRHPFAAFLNAVDAEGLLDEWYNVKNEFHTQKAKEWLEDYGIDFVDGKIVQVNGN